MFDSFKKAIGSMPDRSEVLAVFKYTSNFEIINDTVKVIGCELLKVTIIHHFFRNGQEIEIVFQGQQPTLKYYLTKLPYVNTNNDTIYEITEKTSNNKFLLVVDLNLKSIQFVPANGHSSGYIFSNIELSEARNDGKRLLDLILSHFTSWSEKNSYLLELDTDIETFIFMWQVNILDEVQSLAKKHLLSEEKIKIEVVEFGKALIKGKK